MCLKNFEKHETSTSYNRPEKRNFELSVLIFVDANQHNDHRLLCYLAGLLFSKLESGSTFHILFWSSHRFQRPVKPVKSAEALSAGGTIDDGKVVVRAIQELLSSKVSLSIVVDSEDLFSTLSTL